VVDAMSKRRHRRRDHRPFAPDVWDDPHANVATQIAATADEEPESIDEAKHVSHDQLIATLGARRRSGVRWAIHGPDERDEALATLAETSTATTTHAGTLVVDLDPYADVRAWFDQHPGGVLVVAMAVAT
jgi:hypothetical protein